MIKITNKKVILATILALSIAIQVGCSNINNEKGNTNGGLSNSGTVVTEENKQQNDEKTVMDDFYVLVNNNDAMTRVIKFIDNNISLVSEENASIMVDKLMELQKNYLSILEEKFYANGIQQKFFNENKSVSDLKQIDSVTDVELKELLSEVRENGFKVEIVEGMYFPIIDYEFYIKYSSFVTSDNKGYIEIMADESSQVPAKDAGLVISWDEVLDRALNQEKFINEYPESDKLNDIKTLHKRYVSFLFYGTDNTPLFSYDTKTFVTDAREAYTKAISNNIESELLKSLKGFLESLENSEYKLTKNVEKYRNKAFKNLTK